MEQDTTQDQQPQSLADCYREAEASRLALEGSFEAQSPEKRDALSTAIAAYRACLTRISAASVFSPNETLEDVRTDYLPFLLTEHHLAGLLQKQPTTGPRARAAVLDESRACYERFLHLLDGYEALGQPQARLLHEYDEAPRMFSTLPSDPARRRDSKIAAFRREKDLRAKLEALKSRSRRARQGEDDGGDGDDIAEEYARPVYMTQLEMAADEALQALESINREEEVLAQAPEPLMSTGTTVEEDERRRRAHEDADGASRLDHPLRRLQSAMGGPLLNKAGKPLQPFTIVGSRDELAKGVFRPGHNLPTMSIDEYLEEERRRGGIIEGGGEASGRIPEPDEDDEEKADAATYKARQWDEFTEANPRGSGNTLNRG
ncbi:hypothetical protein PspLS_04776 [Pyricularia sp. CBS 133598]|nr:hypothetical protein PspLS_04776 [Pyricularia sp. CBS 133598]